MIPLVAPGAPAGSYPLSGFDTVNLYNGNLEIRLPLYRVGGRGEAGYTMVLPIERKWNIETYWQNGAILGYSPVTDTNPDWGTAPPLFSPGTMTATTSQSGQQICPTDSGPVWAESTLTRLRFYSADGTEIELVDQATGGATAGVTVCSGSGFDRGKIFVARDGSAATFISDSDIYDQIWVSAPNSVSLSGVLIFRNGVRYRIDSGLVAWIRDRDGNQVTLYYDSQTWELTTVIDSLNRLINITHSSNSVQLQYPGTGGASRVVTVNIGTTDQVCGCGSPTLYDLFGNYGIFNGTTGSAIENVVTSVSLPNGQQYSFLYNMYSEVTQITLPTGGQIRYTFDPQWSGIYAPNGSDRPYVARRVDTRDVYPDGVNLEQHTLYTPSYGTTTINGVQWGLTTVAVDHSDKNSTPLAHERHYFYGSPNNPYNWQQDINYSLWLDGKEYQTDERSADGTTVLRSTAQTWLQRPCNAGEQCPATFPVQPVDPRLSSMTVTLSDTGQAATQTYNYDTYNNKTDIYECDYGGALLRHTNNQYLLNGYDTNTGTHLPSLLSEQTVYDGSGGQASDTRYYYDQTGTSARSSLCGYTDPGTTQRGNLTSISEWLSTTGAYITTKTNTYDVAGNITSTADANNNTTQYAYDDNFSTATTLYGCHSYALITKVTNALNQTTLNQYDYYLGKVTNSWDANNVQSQISYSDSLDRPTLIARGFNTPAETQTAYTYCDTCKTITTNNDLMCAGDQAIKSVMLYDGLGRDTESQQYESAPGYISRKRTYDGLGRLGTVSNPYRPATEALKWTTYSYDGLSRVTGVTTADNSTTGTSYSGNQTTVTDPSGAYRTTVTDAAGRLTQVTEAGLFTTIYGYDALDDLTSVNQQGRARSFGYDSLRRLTSATNPELGPQNAASGTVYYTYYNNGNLWTKADPRGITTTLTYDGLNRVQTKTYSDGITPGVTYIWDTVWKGFLSSVSSSVSTTTYESYDALGHVLHSTQTTSGHGPYAFSYLWNSAGALTSETYPSQLPRTVTFGYDPAARVSSVVGSYNGTNANYATGMLYASHGPISQATLANGTLVEAHGFSADRQQPTSVTAGLLSLSYYYCANGATSCTNNNGNVRRQITGGRTQDYSYSENGTLLNRLASATEANGANWSEYFGYDSFGNGWMSSSYGVPYNSFTPTVSTNFDVKNRLQIQNSLYDNDGNQTVLGGFSFNYDAENRQTTNLVNSSSTTYTYDGDGRRVMKVGGGITTVYVYDAMGELAAEDWSSAPSAPCTTCYLVSDPLGSTRMVANQSGTAVSMHDYYPFGVEIPSGVGGRSSLYGATDLVAEKFTGKERDSETGLDYFGARYMSSAQGRFTSPDPLVWQSWQNGNEEEQARFRDFISNPQNFNLYTYGLNNPLKYNDPTGLDVEIAITFVGDASDEEKKRIIAAVRSYLTNVNVGKVVVRDTADASQDKRTFWQKVKDAFTVDYHAITVDFQHPNQFGNNADKPDFVKATNMMAKGDPSETFGDLRQSDPQQWSNIVAWRVLHESISHAFGIGPDNDQLVLVGGNRAGTLIQGVYGRGRPGIPGLNPADTRAIQKLLLPRSRSYVP